MERELDALATVTALPTRKKKPKRKQVRWYHSKSKSSLGFIQSGVYYIERRINGKKKAICTHCKDADAAEIEYGKWERDPVHYVALGEVRTGADWADACKALFSEMKLKGLSAGYIKEVGAQLELWHSYRGFETLDSFNKNDILAFLQDLMAGRLTGRLKIARDLKTGKRVPERDAQGNILYKRHPDGTLVRYGERGCLEPVWKKVRVPQTNLSREVTRNRYLSALKTLMSWARECEPSRTMNFSDTKVKVGREDRNTRPPRPIERTHYEAVYPHLDPRMQAAQMVLLGAGLRWGELARLKEDDIEGRSFIIRKTKRRKGRQIPVSQPCVDAARKLLDLGGVKPDNGNAFREAIRLACEKAGVAKRYTAYGLRHTYATTCIRNGIDLPTLQARMGHADIKTTQKYLHAVEAEKGDGGFAPI